MAGGQRLLNVVEGEDAVHILAGVDGGVALEAAHAVEHGDLLAQAGGAGLVALQAEGRERLLVVVAAHAVPLEHHQRGGHAAAPFAGLLDGVEVGENGQGIGGFHVVEIKAVEVGTVGMIAEALDAVRAVRLAQVALVVKLHFIRIVSGLFRQRGEEEGTHTKHKQPYNNLFHCFHSLQK